MSGQLIKPALAFLIGVSCLFSPNSLKAQCCSTGSPVGASVYVGVLGKNYLRAITYFRHSYSDTYYQDDHKSAENSLLYNSSFNYTGISVGYGITKRLTLEADAGYYFDKTQNGHYRLHDSTVNFQTRGNGLSNGTITVKYGDYIKPSQQIEITSGLALRFPFSTNPQMKEGVQLNRDVQPSTNAFGISEMIFFSKGFQQITLRIFSINRYDYNFADRQKYKYGNILLNSVFVSKKIFKYCFGIVQIRNEWKTNDKDMSLPGLNGDHKVTDSGYDLVTVCPQLSYSIAGKWNLTALYDIPVYKKYNGKQMTPAWSFALSLTRDFNLGKKLPEIKTEKIN
ncbi:MAG: hypothetical protein WCK34_05660 [Bacteroidota bacterium]